MGKFLWSFLNVISNRVLGLVLTFVLGNIFLPEDLGNYVSITILIAYGVAFSSLKIESGIVQKLNDQSLVQSKDQYFTAGLLISILLGIGCWLGLSLFQWFFLEIFRFGTMIDIYRLVAPIILLEILRQYLSQVIVASSRFKFLATVNLVAGIVHVGSSIVLVLEGYGLYGILFGLYASKLLAILAFASSLRSRFRLSITREMSSAAKDLAGFSFYVFIGFIAVFLDKNIDLFFVNYFLDKSDLAIYNYGIKIGLICLLLGNAISAVNFPDLTKAFSSSNLQAVNKIYSDSHNFSFAALSVGSLAVIYHLEYIFLFLLPGIYSKSVEIVAILIIGLVPFASRSGVGTIFTAKGIPRYGAFINWIALGINLALNVILIPRYGIVGAALATTSSFILRTILGIVLTEIKIKTSYNYWRFLILYLLFALAVGGGIFGKWSLILREPVIVIFAVLVYLMIFDSDQRRLINTKLGLTRKV